MSELPLAVRERFAENDRRRRDAYDAIHGAGAWDRVQREIRTGPNMIALGHAYGRQGFWEYGRG